jgi:hypothetical protein
MGKLAVVRVVSGEKGASDAQLPALSCAALRWGLVRAAECDRRLCVTELLEGALFAKGPTTQSVWRSVLYGERPKGYDDLGEAVDVLGTQFDRGCAALTRVVQLSAEWHVAGAGHAVSLQ